MAKSISLILLFVIGASLGSPKTTFKGFGAAARLSRFPDPYIYGGDIVEGRKYPGQISLQVFGQHDCGGSILNENYILTAAHCSQYSPEEVTILSGTNNLKVGGTKHKVLEIHYHEKYNPSDSWHNDVAVMKVDPPFVFDADKNTAPVTLPPQGQDTPVGSDATVIGWGYLSISIECSSYDGELPDNLYEVSILIWDHDLCNQAYVGDGLTVYPEQICADTPEGNKGSCNGDSGGPLIVNGQVVGLVSWARGCDIKGYPTVYTRVSSYRDWIDSKISG